MSLDAVVVSNIKYLLSQRKIKIGDFEKKLNVGIGYFSRHSKNVEGSISLSLAVKIADEFDISVDDLCSDMRLRDLEKMAAEYGLKLMPLDSTED